MLLMETDIKMKLLLINVENIAEEMQNANFGLILQTLAIRKVKRHWKTEEGRVMQFQEPVNVQVLGIFLFHSSSCS
jgi:hypothetical protein